MLILTDTPAGYPWPVTLTHPSPVEAGKRSTSTFTAQFRFLPQSRLDAIAGGLRATQAKAEAVTTDAGLVAEVLIGWDEVRDAAGAPLPFTPATLAAALDVPGVRVAIVRAWFASLRDGEAGN